MVNQTPDELGKFLAEKLDVNALYNESNGDSVEELLPELKKSFDIKFKENQQNIQNRILDLSMTDFENSSYIDQNNITEGELRNQARKNTRDVFIAFANYIIGENSVNTSNVPNLKGMCEFNNKIFNSYLD